jgi:hypothetical protein
MEKIMIDATTLVECPYCSKVWIDPEANIVCINCEDAMNLDIAIASCRDNLHTIRYCNNKTILKRSAWILEIFKEFQILVQRIQQLKEEKNG